jgi:hypothetical protein
MCQGYAAQTVSRGLRRSLATRLISPKSSSSVRIMIETMDKLKVTATNVFESADTATPKLSHPARLEVSDAFTTHIQRRRSMTVFLAEFAERFKNDR